MNEQHYALVIGIDRYPDISDLHSARKDAESFFNWLIDPNLGAVPKENIRLITTDDTETPPGTGSTRDYTCSVPGMASPPTRKRRHC